MNNYRSAHGAMNQEISRDESIVVQQEVTGQILESLASVTNEGIESDSVEIAIISKEISSSDQVNESGRTFKQVLPVKELKTFSFDVETQKCMNTFDCDMFDNAPENKSKSQIIPRDPVALALPQQSDSDEIVTGNITIEEGERVLPPHSTGVISPNDADSQESPQPQLLPSQSAPLDEPGSVAVSPPEPSEFELAALNAAVKESLLAEQNRYSPNPFISISITSNYFALCLCIRSHQFSTQL